MTRPADSRSLQQLVLAHDAQVDNGLTDADRRVLRSILMHSNGRTGQARPSIERIAVQSGIARRSVIRGIARLVERGYITIERGAGPRGTHLYAPALPDQTARDQWCRETSAEVTARRAALAATAVADARGGVTHDTPGGDTDDTPWGDTHDTPDPDERAVATTDDDRADDLQIDGGVTAVSPEGCQPCHPGGDSRVTGGVSPVSPKPKRMNPKGRTRKVEPQYPPRPQRGGPSTDLRSIEGGVSRARVREGGAAPVASDAADPLPRAVQRARRDPMFKTKLRGALGSALVSALLADTPLTLLPLGRQALAELDSEVAR